jgi:ABC-type uncharacterized transport system substrate-binding protein
VRERPDALFVGLDVFSNNRRAQLVNLASRYTLPATFSNRDFAEIGGLMSYGSDIKDAFRQVGVYVGRILKGAKPAELPSLCCAPTGHAAAVVPRSAMRLRRVIGGFVGENEQA